MNRFLYSTITLVILCLSSCSQVDTPEGIDFFHGTFEQALEKAGEEDKLVFVDIYTTWCGPCKVMSQTVFPDHEVGAYFNSRFISFKLDAEDVSIDGPRIANRYDIAAYPTLLFLNADGTEIGRGVAGYDIEGFLGLAQNVLSEQSANTELMAELSARYEDGDREKNFVQDYLYSASLVMATSYGSDSYYPLVQAMEPVFDEYIETHRNDAATLINGKDFQLIRNYAERRPKSHPAVAFVLENFDVFSEVVPEFALCYFVVECNYSTVLDLARLADPSYIDHISLLDTELKSAHTLVATEDPNNAILKHRLTPRARTEYLVATEDWEGYAAEIDTRLENAKDDDHRARIMGSAANRLMLSGADEYMKLGNEYAKIAYEADETEPINVLNYSSMLVNSGQLEAAIEVNEKMLNTLDPGSPHYNFRHVMEGNITRLKAMLDEELDTDT